MTIFDLRCDRCGIEIVGPSSGLFDSNHRRGVRFAYHPGDPTYSDNSSLVCVACWTETAAWLGAKPSTTNCAVCEAPLRSALHVQSEQGTWRLCQRDAVEFLNALRTVEPKLDAETFELPGGTPHPEAEHG